MNRLHCLHLKTEIDHYLESTSEKMVDKLVFAEENGRYSEKSQSEVAVYQHLALFFKDWYLSVIRNSSPFRNGRT